MPSKYYMPGSRPKNFRRNRAANRIQRAFRRKKSVSKRLATLSKKVRDSTDNRWKDVAQTSQPVNATNPLYLLDFMNLAKIIAGDKHDERQGNKIMLKSFSTRAILQNSVSDQYNDCRIIIVMVDSLFNIPAVTDIQTDQILEPDFVTGSATIGLYSHYKKNSQYKYDILYDRYHQVQLQATGSVRPVNKLIKIQHTFKKPIPIHYQTESADMPVQRFIGMLLISDSTIAPAPLFSHNTRLNWVA